MGFSRLLPIVVCLVATTAIRAQTVGGTVRDSATGQPIPHAVILALSGRDSVLASTTCDERGAFRLPTAAGSITLRVQAIGYQPRIIAMAALGSGFVIVLTRLAIPLDTVHVAVDRGCPRNATEVRAIALWQDATGDLATFAAQRPSIADTAVVINVVDHWWRQDYEGYRTQGFSDEQFSTPRLTPEAAWTATRRNIERFLSGPARPSSDMREPRDALLDSGFVSNHCFAIETSGERNSDTAIVFRPARRATARPDVTGRLWIFARHVGLRELTFEYTQAKVGCRANPAGHLMYQVAPARLPRVIDWWFACPHPQFAPWSVAGLGTPPIYPMPDGPPPSPRTAEQWADWGDHTRWVGSRPAILGTIVNDQTGRPVAGVRLAASRVENGGISISPSLTVLTDSTGAFELLGVEGGVYAVTVAVPNAISTNLLRARPIVIFERSNGGQIRPTDSTPSNGFVIEVAITPAPYWRPELLTIRLR